MSDITIDLSQLITARDKATAAQTALREAERAAARTTLAETDWLITRRAETGKSVPRDILDLRKAARAVLTDQSPGS